MARSLQTHAFRTHGSFPCSCCPKEKSRADETGIRHSGGGRNPVSLKLLNNSNWRYRTPVQTFRRRDVSGQTAHFSPGFCSGDGFGRSPPCLWRASFVTVLNADCRHTNHIRFFENGVSAGRLLRCKQSFGTGSASARMQPDSGGQGIRYFSEVPGSRALTSFHPTSMI